MGVNFALQNLKNIHIVCHSTERKKSFVIMYASIYYRHKLAHDEHPISGVLSIMPDDIHFHRRIPPLCLAALYKSPIENVETLLNLGAQMDATYRYDLPPLVLALETSAGYLDMAELLIRRGAKVCEIFL